MEYLSINSTTQVATTVKNCTILTPLEVPSIRCYGVQVVALFKVNNKMNNDISNISVMISSPVFRNYGNINVTNDDVTWGNTTTLEIFAGKIRDSHRKLRNKWPNIS